MFNSTGNNFGAGVIQFKDVNEGNFLILNAKFTCSPQDADYQAADVPASMGNSVLSSLVPV